MFSAVAERGAGARGTGGTGGGVAGGGVGWPLGMETGAERRPAGLDVTAGETPPRPGRGRGN